MEKVLFTYSTKELTSSDKVRFHYLLKGRNGNQGALERAEGQHLGGTVILVPKENSQRVVEVFQQMKIPFESRVMIEQNDTEERSD